MQQSGPCALSCAFLERSLAAMLIQHAPPRLAVQHAITRFFFSGEAVSVIGYNVGALLTVASDCVGRMELRRLSASARPKRRSTRPAASSTRSG